MKYANTVTFNGYEVVATVLSLSAVPLFDPDNVPQPDTYVVPDEVETGWIKVGDHFLPPEAVNLIPRSTMPLTFMERFTEAEQLAIVAATMSSAPIKLWYDKLIAATEIVYADPRLAAGMQALVDAGLLSESRMAEIIPPEWRS